MCGRGGSTILRPSDAREGQEHAASRAAGSCTAASRPSCVAVCCSTWPPYTASRRCRHALPGTFLFIPRGTVHAPKSVGAEAGRVLAAFVYGGAEQAFERFARLAPADGGAPDMEHLQAVARKYDSEFVGPPL